MNRAAWASLPLASRALARTPAFWLLMLYTVMVFPVQAGVSQPIKSETLDKVVPALDLAP